jgi:hypothetical protein
VKVDLTRRLAKYIASPEVSVIVREILSRKVWVLGEVRNPAATTSGAGRPSSTASPSRADSMTLLANALATFYVEENAKILVRQASAARLTRLNQELTQMQEVYTSRYADVIRLKRSRCSSPTSSTDRSTRSRSSGPQQGARHDQLAFFFSRGAP